MTIWKFPLLIRDQQSVSMPKDAEILTVQMQHGEACLWAEVDPTEKTEVRTILILGTGHAFRRGLMRKYIGTVQDGDFVWHVYEHDGV